MWVLHSVAGLAVVALLGAAGWRLATRLRSGDVVVRLLAAAVWWWLGVQVAGLATVLPVGLGPAPVGAAVAVVLAALVLWRVPPGTRTAPPDGPTRTLLAGVGVGVLALVVISLDSPVIGFDGLLYHLAVPAAWIGDGHLASLPRVVDGLPVEAYPVGTELTIGWLMSVTGSTAIALLVTPVALGLAALAVWTMVRRLGGTAAAGWGAIASTALALPFLAQASQVSTDLAGAAIMACGAAVVLDAAWGGTTAATVAVAGPDRDAGPSAATAPAGPGPLGLLPGPDRDVAGLLTGLVGLLLALGVKTTAACGGLLFVLLAWPARREVLRRLRAVPWWGVAVVVAGGCGVVWLVRNEALHGNPAWPLLASPGGDPVPPLLKPTVSRFVDHPGAVLRAGGTTYLDLAWVILPLFALTLVGLLRRGVVRLVALCGVLGALAWFVAPGTGTTSAAELAAGATRYLMPCWILLAAAGWAVLSGIGGPPTRARPPKDAAAPDGVASSAAGLRPFVVPVLAGIVLVVQLVLAWRYGEDLPESQLVDLDRLPIEHGVLATLIAAVVLVVLLVRPAVPAAIARPRVAGGLAVAAAVLLLVATPGLWSRHATTLKTGRPPDPHDVVLALGATPAWALGPHGAPCSRLVGDCTALRGGLAAGRTVTIGPGYAGSDLCGLPPNPLVVDGFRVWTPSAR